MGEWTKGRIKQHCVDETALMDESGALVARTFISELDYKKDGRRRAADAERLSACWNAMLGISDPAAFIADTHELLDRLETYFDQRSDVVDGDYGVQEPNAEMQHLTAVQYVLAKLGRG